MPFFSIIVPTYNSAATLAATLKSVSCQSFQDYELLVIDGVSKDNTIEIAKDLSLPNWVVHSEKDKGVYDAMNKGIEKAKGQWLFFLGSDDVFADNYVLQDVYTFIQTQSHTDFVYGDVLFKSSGKRHYGPSSLLRLVNEGNICHQSIFYQRNVFDRLGLYNLKYPVYADWDMNIRCFQHPDLKQSHMDRIIAVFDDTNGISSGSIVHDIELLQTLPVYYTYINTKIVLNKSYSYRIGRIILSPFFYTRKMFKPKK